MVMARARASSKIYHGLLLFSRARFACLNLLTDGLYKFPIKCLVLGLILKAER